MKKSIKIISIILISTIMLLSIYFVLFSTKTYTGVVVSSTKTNDYIEFTIVEEETREEITVLTDVYTDVFYCHHEKDIYLDDLMNQPCSTVEVRCKRFFNQNRYSKDILVQFNHESEDNNS